MKLYWLFAIGVGLLATQLTAQEPTEAKGKPKLELKTQIKAEPKGTVKAPPKAEDPAGGKSVRTKASYGVGLNYGRQFKSKQIDVDAQAFFQGLVDGLSDKKPAMTDEEIDAALQAFDAEIAAKRAERGKIAGEKNKRDGETYLTENKKKEGVKTTATGLQYKVLTPGAGKSPKPTDTVTTHYRGTLIDGTEFDSSYARKMPASFAVNEVIPAWTEALQLMTVGSKWQLVVPASLGYGARGAGEKIGPNATLIFEVELISID